MAGVPVRCRCTSARGRPVVAEDRGGVGHTSDDGGGGVPVDSFRSSTLQSSSAEPRLFTSARPSAKESMRSRVTELIRHDVCLQDEVRRALRTGCFVFAISER
jgi:hypothetical protein